MTRRIFIGDPWEGQSPDWRVCQTPIGRLAFPGSVQPVLLPLVEEGLAADAQNLRALADFVACRFERRANGIALQVVKRTQRAPRYRIGGPDRFRKIFRNERRPSRKNQ